jgi:hypothetical protein
MSVEFDVFTPPDPHVVDIVQQSQKIIKELEHSNKKLSDKEKNLQEQVFFLIITDKKLYIYYQYLH